MLQFVISHEKLVENDERKYVCVYNFHPKSIFDMRIFENTLDYLKEIAISISIKRKLQNQDIFFFVFVKMREISFEKKKTHRFF